MPKQPRLGFFSYFLKFGSLVFLEIAYYDILQQFLTSSRDKIWKKKNGGPNLGQNMPKSQRKLGFLLFSQVWFISFPL